MSAVVKLSIRASAACNGRYSVLRGVLDFIHTDSKRCDRSVALTNSGLHESTNPIIADGGFLSIHFWRHIWIVQSIDRGRMKKTFWSSNGARWRHLSACF